MDEDTTPVVGTIMGSVEEPELVNISIKRTRQCTNSQGTESHKTNVLALLFSDNIPDIWTNDFFKESASQVPVWNLQQVARVKQR